MSILITGNKGFIGSGLSGDGIDLKDGVDVVTYKAEKKYDVVIHTAALTSVTESVKDPEAYFRTNVLGTMNMVRQHPEAKFIYLSTAGVYGEGKRHTIRSEVHPTSPYALTKYLGERVVRSMAKDWCVLRLTNVTGDGERGEPNVYQVFKKADILPIYGDGMQTRDFIPVENVRSTIMHVVETAYTGIRNVGAGYSKTVLEVAKEFNKPIQFFPERAGEIKHFGIADAFNYNS
jgi:UDP-glucose 4-epimerase